MLATLTTPAPRISMDDLLAEAYEHLRRVARGYLRHQRAGHTLQPTALVHEAWLKLNRGDPDRWRDRTHFLSTAALAMRQILVNGARDRAAAKRGAGAGAIELDDAVSLYEGRCVDLLALDEALTELQALDPVQCRVVELRFFGGLTVEETADALDLSVRKVERLWRAARAWLRTQVTDAP